MPFEKTILLTGGAGFIGSHVARRLVNNYPEYHIVNLDKLTYAGNLENTKDFASHTNYTFVQKDIRDAQDIEEVFKIYQPTDVIHFAAESHVDRSINQPTDFLLTNVLGTVNLLNACLAHWGRGNAENRFYHISTDEVYGTLGREGLFTEFTSYDPHSPYAASKASSDHFVRAYADTYGINTIISNCSNNYGPYQFPEKLIPLAIDKILTRQPIPIYGTGENVRDWLYVEDHASAIDTIFHNAEPSSTYNVGSNNEWKNIDLIRLLCQIMDRKLGREIGESESLISFVTDRAGHDIRYAIDSSKLKAELNWSPNYQFEEGLEQTVEWYLQHKEWIENIKSGRYQDFNKLQNK